MRLLYLDIDTLRADHLGCYGYGRATSPNIDALATTGIVFEQLYASDSPCLPSRAALFSGRFGINNGVVNHGGMRAEPFGLGSQRGRVNALATLSWPHLLRRAGLWCATISTFAERHSAFAWYAGFNEVCNLGTDGHERADQVTPVALDWLRRKGGRDNWFLHVHFWDPHTPYRTPTGYGDPFADAPLPSWIDEQVIADHWQRPGPHSAQEVTGFGLDPLYAEYSRQPLQVASMEDLRRLFDGYDTGIRYVDDHVGQILNELDALGVADETAVLVSSDHGENLGELGIYSDHQTADLPTHRLPAVLNWPGLGTGREAGFRYHIDLAATIAALAGVETPDEWDGASFADELSPIGAHDGRDHLVLSCAAWTAQRSVRFDRWLYIRTYHHAFHGFPPDMLFDVEADPHEQHDLAGKHPEVVDHAARLLLDWETANLSRSSGGADPLWTVMTEGGGFYTRDQLEPYLRRLEQTGREAWAEEFRARREQPVIGRGG